MGSSLAEQVGFVVILSRHNIAFLGDFSAQQFFHNCQNIQSCEAN